MSHQQKLRDANQAEFLILDRAYLNEGVIHDTYLVKSIYITGYSYIMGRFYKASGCQLTDQHIDRANGLISFVYRGQQFIVKIQSMY